MIFLEALPAKSVWADWVATESVEAAITAEPVEIVGVEALSVIVPCGRGERREPVGWRLGITTKRIGRTAALRVITVPKIRGKR